MNHHRWTAEEAALLEALVGDHQSACIARRLGLRLTQVHNRISRLGLSRKRVGVFSGNELAQILGMEGNWIRKSLIATGLLPSKRTRAGRYGITQITEADLIAFLRDYPHLVDRSNVDAAYQQFVSERWITTVEAFRRGAAHPVELEHGFHAGMVDEVRKRGVRWVIPESILPRLVAGRRRFMDDVEQRRQVRVYDRLQIRQQLSTHRRGRQPRRAA